ncbi:CDP-glycerol glycerophosphotransferase family protein [Shewanella sp. 0m-8]
MTYSILDWLKAILRKLIFMLSGLAPRTSKKAVFGSYKEGFSDNSKYLYLHWQQTKFIRCIWISGNKAVITQLQSQNLEAYYRWSFKGIYHSLTAKYFFYNSYIGDINQWLANGAVKINLWHGLPMKKIEFDITTGPMAEVFNPKSQLAQCKQWLLAHQQRTIPDLMLSPSPLIDSLFCSAFRLSSSQLLRATNPRTDYFTLGYAIKNEIESDSPVKGSTEQYPTSGEPSPSTLTQSIKSLLAVHLTQPSKPAPQPHIILYVPSWRDSHQEGNPYNKAFNWQQLSNHLAANNQLFLLRLHPNEAALADELTSYANIINITPLEDVYSLLHLVDLLITDYSSLFIDVLPQGTPICFYRFDEQHYQRDCRDIYDYATKLPEFAPKCTSFNELLKQLEPETIAARRFNAIDSGQRANQTSYKNNYQAVTELFWGKGTPNAFEALEERIGSSS